MYSIEYAILTVLPISAVVLTVLAQCYGWDTEAIARKQWTVFEGLLALLIVGGSVVLGTLVGGVLGALVAAGFVLYTVAFLAVHYRRG